MRFVAALLAMTMIMAASVVSAKAEPPPLINLSDGTYRAVAPPHWDGKITLRGLAEHVYSVTDYVNGKDFGTVRGPAATLNVQFEKNLLLQAKPE